MKVLATGGAGFVGSHTVDLLLEEAHEVLVLDDLDPQVHGQVNGFPPKLSRHATERTDCKAETLFMSTTSPERTCSP